jgi:hypothetical protein
MKSGSKSLGKKSRHQRVAGQQSSVGQKNVEQQYQELLMMREKVSSLSKTAARSRQQPKRKSRD